MSLKDRIGRDVHRVFLNLNHFADAHTWNRDKITCIVDEDEALKRKNNNVLDINWEPNTEVKVIHADARELPRVIPYETVLFDGKLFKVMDVQTNMGMLTITLAANQAKAVAP